MTRILLLIAVLGTACCSRVGAQEENVWAFGKFAGVDFSNGTPKAITTAFTDGSAYNEAAASVCDDKGRLLFYTEGSRVWDSTGVLMPNGGQLTPFPNTGSSSATNSTSQGALIASMPDNPGKYYIFSLTDFLRTGKLYYSVVDMSLNGGHGDIVANQKGIYLDSGLTEKMTGVTGDDCNIWLLTASRAGAIKAYEVTASGVNHTPVISPGVGLGSGLATEPLGGLAVSPDRTKLAATKMGYNSGPFTAELYDFDPATGKVSHPIPLLLDLACYTACFSPDNTKLYIPGIITGEINQFDISSGDSMKIRNSRTEIGKAAFSQLKLGPDGKIYFFQPGSPSALGCIAAANQAGPACQYTTNVVILTTGTDKGYGLPNVVPVVRKVNDYATATITVCTVVDTVLRATDTTGSNYVWSNGTMDNHYRATAEGTYWLQYHTAPCVQHVDTFVIHRVELEPVITADSFQLSTMLPYDTYQWLLNGEVIPEATSQTYSVMANGDYSVIVGDYKSGCADTSAPYTVSNATAIDDAVTMAMRIKVYPNPASDFINIQAPVPVRVQVTSIEGKIMEQGGNLRVINVKSMPPGVYFIRISNAEGTLLKVEKFIRIS